MDRVFLRGLRFDCIIGMLDRERLEPQPLVVDATLYLPLSRVGRTGDLGRGVDYAQCARLIMDYAQQRQARLLEELAEGLCDEIFRATRARRVRLRLTKPLAVPGAEGAGIEIKRSKR
ncbi:MAG: dihydroneopterin aldolase [Succinivibrionaceae bacterium]|nr:dihydroneopterin aldolase [Succinivibrionaceae bacterium]